MPVESGPWSVVHRPWSIVHGLSSMVHRPSSVVHGPPRMVTPARCTGVANRASSGWIELETRIARALPGDGTDWPGAEHRTPGATVNQLPWGRDALDSMRDAKRQIALWSRHSELRAPRCAHSVCIRAVIRSIRVPMCSSRHRRARLAARSEADDGLRTIDDGR